MKARTLIASAAALAIAPALAVVTAPAAQAAPAACTASEADVFAAPGSVSGGPGELLACRNVTLTQVPGNIPMRAVQVRYVSTDLNGKKVPVTGTVAVPTARWTGQGSRPTVAFNPGTLGIGRQCAFSKQLAGAYQDEYEGEQVAAFLKAGFAVAATDGMGYIEGLTHPYMIGANAGHSLLDIARASRQVPGGTLTADGKIAISGYSEGGAASLWASQLAASYAPELKVVGAAAGGVPGDLKLTAKQLNGGAFAGFLADAVVGLHEAYPTLPFDELVNDNGRSAVADTKKYCLYGTLARFLGARVESFTTKGYSLDQLYALKDANGLSWGDAVEQQKLGVNIGRPGSGAKYQIGFPTYQYRGYFEEIIPHETEEETRRLYCKAGITTQFNNSYPGEHLLTDSIAINDVTSWIGDRFAGKFTFGNCPLF
ncbi:lipase family protein [Actinocorallia longicatena]|uniref:Lipase family protein n=1 Tax=Actinocorallia longicatena TaxID=111803 RepID=A0ABP6Q9U2_9ACTN